MKDANDKATKDLLPTEQTKAQRFKAKQRALGLRQFTYWLTNAEADQLKAHIEHMRSKK